LHLCIDIVSSSVDSLEYTTTTATTAAAAAGWHNRGVAPQQEMAETFQGVEQRALQGFMAALMVL
jgi:hypothetical protein